MKRLRRRRVPVFYQTELADCGLACLAMIGAYYGHKVDVTSLKAKFGTSSRGTTIGSLERAARALGFDAAVVELAPSDLQVMAEKPLLLHLKSSHYVVLQAIEQGLALVNDPERGCVKLPLEELSSMMSGLGIVMMPGDHFDKLNLKGSSWRVLISDAFSQRKLLALLFIVTVAMELLVLVLPLQLRFVIDDAVSHADLQLLKIGSIFFLLVLLTFLALSVTRSALGNSLGIAVSSKWMMRLFDHTIHLPTSFFQRRSTSDTISRFSSVGALQYSMTVSSVELAIGALSSAIILCLLVMISLPMATVVLVAVSLSIAAKSALYPITAALNEQCIVLDSSRNNIILESVRGVQAIRIAGKERSRIDKFSRSNIEFSYNEARLQSLLSIHAITNQTISHVQRAALITIGALLIVDESLTIGMVVSFLAYAEMFSWRVAGFIDRVTDVRVMKIHADRIGDILRQPQDQRFSIGSEVQAFGCALEICGVGYKPHEDDSWIIRGVSLHLPEGKSLAIYGPSGSGKSTLAKIVLGLIQPTEGSVRLGRVDISRERISSSSCRIASVMQDDVIFSGTIADNVAFEEEAIDEARIEEVCRQVGVHDEIARMPMRYHTLVGEGGNAISGGQKQRIMIARALYRTPQFLVLDEATSALDPDSEARVNATIRSMGITTLVIAHRIETIRAADISIDIREVTKGSCRG